MTKRKYEAGTVLSVPFAENRVGFCRLLKSALVEFFDKSIATTEEVDVEELVNGPVAFRVAVMNAALNSRRWKVVGRVPLSNEEQTKVHVFFKRDVLSGALSAFWVDPSSGEAREQPAGPDQCEGLEPAAVWSANHIEDRLRDHFDGRSNKWVESLSL